MERRVENFFGESVDRRQAATSPGNTASTKSDVLCPVTARARRWEDIAGQTWYSGDGCRPQACRPQANPCDSSKQQGFAEKRDWPRREKMTLVKTPRLCTQ